jgi:hypothetical protein
LGVLVVRGILPTRTTSGHAVAHIRAAAAFLSETRLILEEICDVLCLLTDVGALVLTVLVEVLEFFERLDEIDVVSEVDDDVLGSSMETVVEQRECLQESWIRAPRELWRNMTLTLKTCRQFLPLSLSRLSSISMISTKSFLDVFELVGGWKARH